MKTSFAVLTLFFLFSQTCTVLAMDTVQLEALLDEAFGDDERTCAVIEMIDREIATRPNDERLRRLRIAAHSRFFDPYSAKPDVDALAALHPDSPPHQIYKCIYAEATGATQEEYRQCYLQVAELCRRQGKADAHSHEYLLALLLAESPEAGEAMQRFLAALSDSPMDQALKENLPHFSRENFVRKKDPKEIRHPCPRRQ